MAFHRTTSLDEGQPRLTDGSDKGVSPTSPPATPTSNEVLPEFPSERSSNSDPPRDAPQGWTAGTPNDRLSKATSRTSVETKKADPASKPASVMTKHTVPVSHVAIDIEAPVTGNAPGVAPGVSPAAREVATRIDR